MNHNNTLSIAFLAMGYPKSKGVEMPSKLRVKPKFGLFLEAAKIAKTTPSKILSDWEKAIEERKEKSIWT